MRRAVAACTSPEVFFRDNAADTVIMSGSVTDPLGLAMEALDISALA